MHLPAHEAPHIIMDDTHLSIYVPTRDGSRIWIPNTEMPMAAGVDPESALPNPRGESMTLTPHDMMPNRATLGSNHTQEGAAISDQEDATKDKAGCNDLNTNHNRDEQCSGGDDIADAQNNTIQYSSVE